MNIPDLEALIRQKALESFHMKVDHSLHNVRQVIVTHSKGALGNGEQSLIDAVNELQCRIMDYCGPNVQRDAVEQSANRLLEMIG